MKHLIKYTLSLYLLTSGQVHVAAQGQIRAVTLAEAIQAAVSQNPGLKATAFETVAAERQKRTSVDIPKTQAMLMYGQYNSLNKDNNITITQSLPFPTVFSSQSRLGELRIESSRHHEAATRNDLVFQVKQTHQTLLYLLARQHLLKRQDSLFGDLVRITTLHHATGEGTLLQKTAAETRYNDVQNQLRQNAADRLTMEAQLKVLMNSPVDVTASPSPFEPLGTLLQSDSTQIAGNPHLAYQQSLTAMALQERRVEKNRALPDLSLGYFNQTLVGYQRRTDGSEPYFSSSDRFSGFMVGVALPIWFVPARARIKTAEARGEAARMQADYAVKQLYGEWDKALQQFEKYRNSLDYYTRSAIPNAELLLRQSTIAYRAGDISQADYRLNVQQALGIEEAYLQTLLSYNISVLTLEYLTGTNAKN